MARRQMEQEAGRGGYGNENGKEILRLLGGRLSSRHMAKIIQDMKQGAPT
jgi:hypothetical protein